MRGRKPGVPLSKEHRAAISRGMRASAHVADAQRRRRARERAETTTTARLVLVPLMLAAFFMFGRAVDAQTDPAVPACQVAIAEGSYTPELYGQCLDDYADAGAD